MDFGTGDWTHRFAGYVRDHSAYIPFVGLAMQQTGSVAHGATQNPLIARLIELGVVGAMFLWGTQQVFDQRLDTLAERQTETRAAVENVATQYSQRLDSLSEEVIKLRISVAQQQSYIERERKANQGRANP